MSESWHGTRTGYVRHKCRCDACRKANSDWQYQRRRDRTLDPEDSRHGTVNGYVNYRCRCVDCTEANTLRRDTVAP